MSMQIYRKLKAAENAVATHMSTLERLAKDMMPIFMETRSKAERQRGGWMPDDVTSISVNHEKDTITFSGYRYGRGCTDGESITLPKGLVFGSNEDKVHIIQHRMEVQAAEEQIELRMKEAKERAELERLQEKFK